jgi:hypothetical protein
MPTRWLAGMVLFALGFGCALLVNFPEASAASKQGLVSGSLKYVDSTDFQLIYPPGGKTDYLVVVSRKPGTVNNSEPLVAYKAGSATFSKKNLDSLIVYEVRPLVIWKDDVSVCGRGPVQCILPPPPPPPWLRYAIVKSGPVPIGRPD